MAATGLPLAALACLHVLLVPQIVMTTRKLDPKIETWVVASYRSVLAESYFVFASCVIVYWLLAAILCRGQFLAIRSANVTLALSGAGLTAAMVVSSVVPTPALLLKWACPVLGLSDTNTQFGLDVQTSCETFAGAAIVFLLPGVPALLLVASACLRIVVSRRRWRISASSSPF